MSMSMFKLVPIIFLLLCCFSLYAHEEEQQEITTQRTLANEEVETTTQRTLPNDEVINFQKSLLRVGDFPVLNRKVFKGMRSSIQEHPYVVSIRRNMVHYVTGTILSKTVILTVAHAIAGVPTHTLGVVVGENYCDRGTSLLTVIIVVIHEDFDPYTFQNDLALVKIFERLTFRVNVKPVIGLLRREYKYNAEKVFLTGWGRCDLTGEELCFPRHSVFTPNERLDPMLRTVQFKTKPKLMELACLIYKKMYDITIRPGMLCLGEARRISVSMQCMAVPGAPAVIDGRLLGISSWGYSCGYDKDLPVIFTDVRYYYNWIYDNLEVFHAIPKTELRPLYKATICYKSRKWLTQSRKEYPTHEHADEEIIPSIMDKSLARLKGDVYDFRNYFYNRKYDQSKTDMYAVLRHIINKTEALNEIMQQIDTPESKPFISYDSDYYFESDQQ